MYAVLKWFFAVLWEEIQLWLQAVGGGEVESQVCKGVPVLSSLEVKCVD